MVAELERRGYSLGDSRRGETSPDIYYADRATHTKPRIIVSRTRIRIQTKTAATPYKDWKSFSRKTELELALESIDRLPQSGKPTTARQAPGQDDRPRSGKRAKGGRGGLRPPRDVLVAQLEQRGYALGNPYLSESSPNIYYADRILHKKPRIVITATRIRIETKTSTTPYRLWKSFALHGEAGLALETLDRLPNSRRPGPGLV